MLIDQDELARVTGLQRQFALRRLLDKEGLAYSFWRGRLYTTERHVNDMLMPGHYAGTHDEPGPLYPHDTVLTLAEIIALPSEAPDAGGVYFLLLNGAVVYVGRTLSFASRARDHHYSRRHGQKNWDEARFLATDRLISGWLEVNHIVAYQPRYNRLHR